MKRYLRGKLHRIRRLRRSMRPQAAAIAALAESFDVAWYLERYPDVTAAGVDPLGHFRDHGADEGRLPNRFIDPEWYARFYKDLGSQPALFHYARIGRRERRDPGPDFGAGEYLAANPDVAAAGIEPLMHYIRHGRAEGRLAFRSPLAGHRTTSRAAEALVARFTSDARDAGFSLHVPDEILLRINEAVLRRGTRVSD
ncbi:hypothetical protein [Methylobacterium haplocladii]|uniref:Uncharacterized protein n=1 Tax=Methylobacterium haplocladii TaxID=1176176 RepID=A0A512IMS7_9HYPH|nr:hypothetical protein [Methylobacterium haplocladii]GEO99016.1 hypothetical protein MHA02_14040 [Methylobacterium haplocladii]GJD84137.1 hypothetical protein HPGCJGGD_2012 [Methylobacterium haplocladii]GLS58984.1 hypothetical protein GCM10007887_16500 [Methylobacterium haplocladii]